MYQICDSDGDGAFMDETWKPIFTYPDLAGSHHDGLEFVGDELWISDMTSNVLVRYKENESNGQWELKERYCYSEPEALEGMGFGPNDHFWCGSEANRCL